MDYIWHYDSPIGGITMGSNGTALVGLWFDTQKYFADTLGDQRCERALPVFDESCRWLDIYFSGKEPGFTPSLTMRGSSFRREVWEILMTIPYGRTMTYGEIAARLAAQYGLASMSAQAVGGAVGHNPISLIVPCHRVVGTGGRLIGFAAGIDRKAWLLAHENESCSLAQKG